MPDDNTSVTVDGFQFETLMPERRISASSEIGFGVRITNQTHVPQQFLLFWLMPVFFRKNKQWKQVCYLGFNSNTTQLASIWDCHIVTPGESLDFAMKGRFILDRGSKNWYFGYRDKRDAHHDWESFQPGTHGLQCEYNTSSLKRYLEYYAKNSNHPRWIGVENSWVGEAITPLIEFQLM